MVQYNDKIPEKLEKKLGVLTTLDYVIAAATGIGTAGTGNASIVFAVYEKYGMAAFSAFCAVLFGYTAYLAFRNIGQSEKKLREYVSKSPCGLEKKVE